MNVSNTFLKLYGLIFLLSIPLMVNAQLESYEVISGESLPYSINSFPVPITQNDVSASHGTIQIVSHPQNEFEIIYTPYFGYIGLDTLVIEYFENFSPSTKGVEISVIPSKVTTESDYATTSENTPISINVTDNDYASRGVLNLTGIPLVQNGFAIIESPSTLLFIPETGFEGIATLNYIVCDDINTCETGTVTISVIGTDQPPQYDTVFLSSVKNTIIPIPLSYDDFEVEVAPSNGSAAFSNSNLVEYEPNTDFIGLDEFTLKRIDQGTEFRKIFIIDVISDLFANGVAFDDYAHTPVNTPVDIDVSNNDIGDYGIVGFTQSPHGLVEKISAKILRFTPNAAYEGVTSFTYKINVTSGVQETATVFVTVANQNPSASEFNLSTLKNVPKPIYYNIPIEDFSFSIAAQAQHGVVNFYPGDIDTLIYGHQVAGHNLVIYTPDVDFVGIDQFEVLYCVTTNQQCQLTKIVMEVKDLGIPNSDICVDDDCVWPGDGNNDGVVNMIDLLFVGANFGDVGYSRPNASVLWYGQYSDEWLPYTPSNGVDTKYSDMDGNGTVEYVDLNAMDACYYLTHSLTPEYNPFEKNYPIYLELISTPPFFPGDLVEYNIKLGKSANPAYDIYGLTFSFDYDYTKVEAGSMQVEFYNDSWFTINSPTISMVKEPFVGRMDIGLSRTSGYSASGYGDIGKLEFIVEDDVEGRDKAYRLANSNAISLHTILGFDGQMNYIQLPEYGTSFEIAYGEDATGLQNEDLRVYPNPTEGLLNLHLNGDNALQSYQLYTTTGHLVRQTKSLKGKNVAVQLYDLPTGIYILRVQTELGLITQKVQIQKL